MADLLLHHVSHHVRRGPHALADLRPAGHAAGQPDRHIALFVGGDPVALLDIALRQHRASLHRRMDFIAGPIKEAGVDEHDPVLYRVNTGCEVRRGPAFFVHHTHLDGVTIQPEQIFYRIEQFIGEGTFFRPVHFRLHDID